MNEINRCPKCKQLTLANTSHRYIRDEWIHFAGKCLNCGYEIGPEEILNELKAKFDFEKDLEHLVQPLEFVLAKTQSGEHELRRQILLSLIKIYEEKAQIAESEEEFEGFFERFLSCQQALEGRALRDSEVLFKKGLYRRKADPKKAADFLEQAFINEFENAKKKDIAGELVNLYEKLKQYDKAIEYLDKKHELRDRPQDIPKSAEDLENNLYLDDRGQLLLKTASYQKALESLQQVKYTREMMEYVEGLISRGEKKIEISHEYLNSEAEKLAFCAAYKAGAEETAMSLLSNIQNKDPVYLKIESPLSSFENDYYFLCLIEYLSAKDIAKAFNLVKNVVWADGNIASVYNTFEIYLHFLKGKVFVDYAISCKDVNLMKDAQECFENVIKGAESTLLLISDDPDKFSILALEHQQMYEGPLSDWVSFFGKVQNLVPQAHKYLGRVFETIHNTGNAFYEYNRAKELNQKFSNPLDADLDNKVKEFSLRMEGVYEKEWDKTLEELSRLTTELKRPQTEQAYQSVLHKCNSLLLFAKEKLPQIIEDVKDIKGDIENKKRPFRILPQIRDIVEGYFLSICKFKISDLEDYTKFTQLTSDLVKKGEITSFIRSILLFIWFSCSEAAHSLSKPQIRSLRWEDIELVIAAMLRFLSWYCAKYPVSNI